MNILEEIIAHKKKEIEKQSAIVTLERLKEAQRVYSIRDFKSAINLNKINIIAEIKRKSPSEKDIMLNANPVNIAVSYEENGAAAISVLTDEKYFGGSLDFIKKVKDAVRLPVLRKDFIISEYQVWESFYYGADAILLIADAIDYELLDRLYSLATDLGLHVLIESHSLENIKSIVKLNPDIVGINCRDLKTMKTNINWFKKVFDKLPMDAVKVAESGIGSVQDVEFVSSIGYNSILVGTSLMKMESEGGSMVRLLNRVSV